MKYFLVGLYIIMVQSPLIAQTGVYMEMSIATDYTTTPSVARYK